MHSLGTFSAIGLLLALLQGCASPSAQQPVAVIFSPYKHINMEVDAAHPLARTRENGKTIAVVDMTQPGSGAPLPAITLAFASGECGQERWGELNADSVAEANVKAMAARQLSYVISTGGEGNVFTCQTDAGMEKFITRYASPYLVGLDFDIEATQTPAHIREIVERVKVAQGEWPRLRFSFTLATFAASDGSGASLNATGKTVMQALKDVGVQGYYINLMVMNFGPAAPAHCVVKQGRCDMAASARQAVENLHTNFGVPLSQIEVTAMIGVNDVVENVFTPEDATALAQYVRTRKLAGLHYWSLDRDKPCAEASAPVQPICSGLNQVPEGAFLQNFLRAWGSER
jgi:chitinase